MDEDELELLNDILEVDNTEFESEESENDNDNND